MTVHHSSLRWIAIGMVIALLLLAGPVTIREIAKRRLNTRVQAAVDAIGAAGHPTTLHEIESLHAGFVDTNNSASVYLWACSNFVARSYNSQPLEWMSTNKSPFAPIPDETRSAILQWATSNKTSLALAKQGAKMPQMDYPLDLSKLRRVARSGPLLGLHHLSELLAWEAMLAAERDDTDLAVDDMETCLLMTRPLKNHPYPIAQMTREANVDLACEALERTLNRSRLSAMQLERITKALDHARGIDWIKASMLEERCMRLDLYRSLPRPKFSDLLSARRENREYAWWHFLLFPQKEVLDYLTLTESYVGSSTLPLPERLVAEIGLARDPRSSAYRFTKWFRPPILWAKFTSRYARSQAGIRCAETALAVEKYRAAHHGRIPAGLEDLVPEFLDKLPLGPTDGRPLAFRTEAPGYAISTVVLLALSDRNERRTVSFKVLR